MHVFNFDFFLRWLVLWLCWFRLILTVICFDIFVNFQHFGDLSVRVKICSDFSCSITYYKYGFWIFVKHGLSGLMFFRVFFKFLQFGAENPGISYSTFLVIYICNVRLCRGPFDLTEAESECIAGVTLDFSGIFFAQLFIFETLEGLISMFWAFLILVVSSCDFGLDFVIFWWLYILIYKAFHCRLRFDHVLRLFFSFLIFAILINSHVLWFFGF